MNIFWFLFLEGVVAGCSFCVLFALVLECIENKTNTCRSRRLCKQRLLEKYNKCCNTNKQEHKCYIARINITDALEKAIQETIEKDLMYYKSNKKRNNE